MEVKQKRGSAGGKVTAISQRKQALDNYYKDPKICKCCGTVIEVKENQKVREVKRKQFCNQSCAAAFNNAKRGNYKSKSLVLSKNNKKYYKHSDSCICGEEKTKKAKLCLECYNEQISSLNKTKGELHRDSYYFGRIKIGRHARKIFQESGIERKCIVCGYNHHVDVAHIKAIADFPDEATLDEINNINNLTTLCPNHHWEYDHGILDLKNFLK